MTTLNSKQNTFAGPVEVEVTKTLRDWPELEVGSKVRGILVDISRVWYKFDGNAPHMTMHWTPHSIVLFTRKK